MATARLFWIVKGGGPATCEHPSADLAEAEAARLAAQYPGEVFHVLGPESAYVKQDVSRIDLVGEAQMYEYTGRNGLPF